MAEAHGQESAVAGALPSRESLTRYGELITKARKAGASAIHVGPVFDEATQSPSPRLAFRVAGKVEEAERLDDDRSREILSCTKRMAGLDPSEGSLPQESRIMLQIGGEQLDILVGLVPTVLGERLVLRLFRHEDLRVGLRDLGAEAQAAVRRWCARPWGLVLLAGPAFPTNRSALYALLAEARGHVVSVEEPVDSVVPGIVQIQVDRRLGLTPARGIRSAMRQDPDVLGIGEVREREEADLAIEAALAGHLVVAQVSSRGAEGLRELGVDAAALSRALIGTLAMDRDPSGRVTYRAIEAPTARPGRPTSRGRRGGR